MRSGSTPCSAKIALPFGLCNEQNLKSGFRSFFKMNCTKPLHRLQIPSNNNTGLSLFLISDGNGIRVVG